jgi:hypothetical protein
MGLFRDNGLIYRIIDGVQRVLFNEIILGESDTLREPRDIDFGMEYLSMRRRNANFGWINRPE